MNHFNGYFAGLIVGYLKRIFFRLLGQYFYMPDALPCNQPTVPQAWEGI